MEKKFQFLRKIVQTKVKHLFKSIILGIYLILISCGTKDDPNIIKLFIDIDDIQEMNYSDIFDSYEIIPLETSQDILIGEIDKVLFSDDLIFVLDKRITKTVFAFGKEGKFRFKITSQGFGPGELYSPTNITLNHDKQELVVVDGRQGKFLIYDFEGRYKKEIKKVEMSSPYDININDGKFYIVDGFTDNWSERLKVTDDELNVIKSIDVFMPEDFKLIEGKKSTYLYEQSGKRGFFYKEALYNRFIEIKGDAIEKNYIFIFSDEQFKATPGKIYKAFDFDQEFRRADKYAIGDNMVNSENFSLIGIAKGDHVIIALWDRQKNKVTRVSQFLNDMDGILFPITGIPPGNGIADLFVFAIHPKDLAYASNRHNGSSIPYDNYAKEKGIQPDDNPILFVYKMKASLKN
jgi:hypothetical protein